MTIQNILKDSNYKLTQFKTEHKDPNYFEPIPDIPKANKSLKDILKTQKRSLKNKSKKI